jgi:hypothetical protein
MPETALRPNDAERRRIGEGLFALRRTMTDAKASRSARAKARAALRRAVLQIALRDPQIAAALRAGKPAEIKIDVGGVLIGRTITGPQG